MEESDSGIVPGKPVNKVRAAARRNRWREGPGTTGDALGTMLLRTQSREAPSWVRCGSQRCGTADRQEGRHNRSEEPDALTRTSGSVSNVQLTQRIFWSGARQEAAGSERRRPGAAPLGKKSDGVNR